ncbi:hypothetical protein WK03_16945 [Burkholderia cepacia]|uniref:rhamnan synthesis F family protein n=1 Tax=Burkholderia cepacia TaxID=292 RepID=UPI00076D3B60|nr:rhamnan synthesis F family protein [Burkholderia cepacia]KVQ43589.1 hypothetical protein WK03_16945 [Burkholderia cepacia]
MLRNIVISRLSRVIRISQVHRAFFWCWDRFEFYTSKHEAAKLEKIGEKKASRLAILAIFQMKGLSIFVKREVDFLVSLGYDVAVSVPHGLSEEDRAFLDARCRFRISRPNTGRDFGSYRDGILQVGFERIAEYKRVLLLNDSIYFPIGPVERFAEEFIAATSRADVVGLTENASSIRHLASFFVDSCTKIFCSDPVVKYWTSYKLYNSRFYAIRHGECGLSQVLYKCAKSIELLYSAERITEAAYRDFDGKIDNLRSTYLLSDPFWRDTKRRLISQNVSRSKDASTMVFVDNLRQILEGGSVPHSFGLHLFVAFDAPFLKRDVYYHEIYDLPQVQSALQGKVDDEILDKIILELRKRGAAHNQTFWTELMVRLGIR